MNTFIKITKQSISSLLFLAMICTVPLQAQDNAKMEKDLGMMEKVLKEVFRTGNPEPSKLNVRSQYADAQYVEGFGIILRTPLFYWSSSSAITLSGRARTITIDGDRVYSASPDQAVAPDDDDDQEDADKFQDEIDQKKIDLMTFFLMNYGDLASELPQGEQVMLVYGRSSTDSKAKIAGFGVAGQYVEKPKPRRKPGTITVAATKRNIDRFRKKDIDEAAFKKTLIVENIQSDSKDRMAYNILGEIIKDVVAEHDIKRRWKSDRRRNEELFPVYVGSGTWNTNGPINYEVLPGYGVVYKLKNKNSAFHVLNVDSRKRNQKDEKDTDSSGPNRLDQLLDSIYQEMVPAVQSAMIEYGRTLRDLEPNEWLSVHIDIPPCHACEAPATVEINVPQKVLDEYDRRNISLDTAIGRMEVSTKGKAKDKTDKSNFIYFGNGYNQWDEED